MELTVLSLHDLLEEIGEDGFYDLISDFYCEKDEDVTFFLHKKAVPFEKSDYNSSRTYLVGFPSEHTFFNICGYFSLSNKPFELSKDVSKTFKKRLSGGNADVVALSSILIGQLGKNSYNDLGLLITGKDLLVAALQTIENVYKYTGLNLVHLECKDIPQLRKFYEDNGFRLYKDNSGNPILVGKDSKLLCYIAKYKDIITRT